MSLRGVEYIMCGCGFAAHAARGSAPLYHVNLSQYVSHAHGGVVMCERAVAVGGVKLYAPLRNNHRREYLRQ